MQLQAGKKYVDRRGRVYGPLFFNDSGTLAGESPQLPCVWHINGRIHGMHQTDQDLVAPHLEFTVVNGLATPDADPAYTVSTDPNHVMRPGVDQVGVLDKWCPWSACGNKTLGETAFRHVRYLKSAAPVKPVVESPDDWVEITDPDHVLRSGIDFIFHAQDCEWSAVRGLRGIRIGDLYGSYTNVRCRRCNLPVTLDHVLNGIPPVSKPAVSIWRLLDVGEEIRTGDQFNDPDDGWRIAEHSVGCKLKTVQDVGWFRRRVDQADTKEMVLCVRKLAPLNSALFGFVESNPIPDHMVPVRFEDGKFYVDVPKG